MKFTALNIKVIFCEVFGCKSCLSNENTKFPQKNKNVINNTTIGNFASDSDDSNGTM